MSYLFVVNTGQHPVMCGSNTPSITVVLNSVLLATYMELNNYKKFILPTTYLQVIKTQLNEKHFQTLEDAMMEAKDREKWRAIVQDRSFLADNGQQ